MSGNIQTIRLGDTVFEGVTYDIYADLTNLPPVGELDPAKVVDIASMAVGLFEAHAETWKKGGVSLAGKVVTLSDQGAAVDANVQQHEKLPSEVIPAGIWEETKDEIVNYVSRFKTYYQSIIDAPDPEKEMQKLIKHLRTNARIKDAEILEEIHRFYLKNYAGKISLKEALEAYIQNKKT